MVVAVLSIAACATATRSADLGANATAKPAIRVLAQYELSGSKSIAFDLRWAGAKSVFITTSYERVAEHGLSPGLPVVRELFPAPRVFDAQMVYGHLAVTSETMVVGAPTRKIAWRPLERRAGGTVDFLRDQLGAIGDLDLQGNRLAWIGWSKALFKGPDSNLSGYAWIDELGNGLDSPQQLITDVSGGRRGERADPCLALRLGSLRFQPDGSLLIAPGILDEIALFDPAGHKFRSWDARYFGVESASACTQIKASTSQELDSSPLAVGEWINRQPVIDEALATPAGPAIVIRTMKSGLPTWRLHVLGADRVTSYDLPLSAQSPYTRLAGDVRGSQLAVLLYDHSQYPRRPSENPDRVVLLELPMPNR
jgi:hypothetical protein